MTKSRCRNKKQWGKACRELPAAIIKRIPVRFTYDNNYFDDPYQGVPTTGYTAIVKSMLEGSDLLLGVDYLRQRDQLLGLAKKIVYTGPIDGFFNYEFGPLTYRSLRFEEEILDIENYQGNAVVNYTDRGIPYTRIIEHKHFLKECSPKTVITKEYPLSWTIGREPYYPVNDAKNQTLFQKYAEKAQNVSNVIFGGRLGEYRYYDMDCVIAKAIEEAQANEP